MVLPTWNVGQVLTASDLNSYLVPAAIVKPSDQAVTNSTTLQNDSALTLAMAANAQYAFHCYFYANGPVAANFKWTWSQPAGTTTRYVNGAYVNAAGATVIGGQNSGGDTVHAAMFGASNPVAFFQFGTILTGGSAGNFQLQWAQDTANASATTLSAQSCLMMQRVG